MNRHIGILSIYLLISSMLYSQGMKMGELLIISSGTPKKELTADLFKTKASGIITTSKEKNLNLHLFKADRGDKKGNFLLVNEGSGDNTALSSDPFNDFSGILDNAKSFTVYQLIGADKFGNMPASGILGLHYIKVKPERAQQFEKFVVEKLHPQVGHLFSDMQMMYYKAINGDQKGTYLLVFSIASPSARDKYWPEGKPETELLKAGFKPMNNLAAQLEPFLIKDSYLQVKSGGAAAIFESVVWTDYIHQDFLK